MHPLQFVAPVAAVLSLACSTPLWAQESMDGRWTAHFTSAGSQHRQAELLIQGTGGTWTPSPNASTSGRHATGPDKGQAKKQPLASQPLSLLPGPSSTYLLRVQGKPGSAGGQDIKARLTVVDSNTLEGEFDDGRVLRIVRP